MMEAVEGTTQIDFEKDDKEIVNGLPVSSNGIDKGQIGIEIIRKVNDFELLRNEWDRLLKESEAHIFQSFEWQYIWWHHFGGENRLHIIVFRKSEKLIGIVPLFMNQTALLGGQSIRKLKFIGSSIPGGETIGTFADYSPTDYLDIIAHPDYKEDIVEAFLDYLDLTWDQFDKIDFEEVCEDGIVHTHLIPEMDERGWSYKKKRGEVCPYITYPDRMEEYLSNLDRKARYELRYSKRAVTEKELFSVSRAESEQDIEKVFSDFVELHQKRWNKQGMPGAFADQRYADFLKDIAAIFNQRGWLRLTSAVDNEGSCIAVDYAFAYKSRTYDYQKAFDDETSLAKYSPGRALMYFLMEEAIQNDRSVFELLRGGEKYKFRVANDSKYNWKVTIPNPKDRRGFKYRLFRLHELFSDLYRRMGRERLLMGVHLQEWGVTGFIPRYGKFLYRRIKDKLAEKVSD